VTISKAQVDEAERTTKFDEPPPYGLMTVEDRRGRIYSWFSTHNSLRAIKTHVTSSNTTYNTYSGRRVHGKDELVAKAHYRIYEYHPAGGGWLPIYDIPEGCVFKKEHELWKGKAPTEKVAAPDQDVDAAIASILGVGDQQEDES